MEERYLFQEYKNNVNILYNLSYTNFPENMRKAKQNSFLTVSEKIKWVSKKIQVTILIWNCHVDTNSFNFPVFQEAVLESMSDS